MLCFNRTTGIENTKPSCVYNKLHKNKKSVKFATPEYY